MHKMRRKKIITYVGLLVVLLLFLAGCGGKEETEDGVTYFHHSLAEQQETQTTQETQPVQTQEVYLITGVNQSEESMQLYRYANSMEYRYYYGTGTRFYDKYQTRTSVSNFTPGLLITIGAVNSEGILTEASISDQAWVYDDVTRFSIDTELGMLKIADSKYRYGDDTFVFSEEEQVGMEDIAKGDTLSVVGVDKQILSVRITTAQGTLELTNTELFDGSFVQVGTKVFAEITPEFCLQIPEGTYELRVANNGWGGSTEITIQRGQTTVVDLDKIKGDGPKYGKIQFVVDVKDAILVIDGKETDYEKPIKLTYGNHSIALYASGYDAWKRNLYVNSKKSTVVINLMEETESESQKDTQNDSEQESETDTEKASENSEKTDRETLEEQLELIQDLITGMTSASSIVSN